MKLGIVGLPNVGKSTLFNSLTKAGAESANYPFCTIDPNVGVVTVPDKRLDVLGEMYHTKKIIPAAIEFVDIAGLVKGASKGEGLGNQFLANIREVDAIVHVVRCFENTNIVHVDGSIDPLRDIETINLELIFSDLEVLERRIAKTVKLSRNDKTAAKELDLLQRLKAHLEDNKMAKSFTTDDEDEQAWLAEYNLLTAKPVIFAANVSEDDLADDGASNEGVQAVREYAKEEDCEVFVVCAEIEEEISQLDEDEKKMFLDDLGLEESGLEKLIKASYHLLGLISYLTAGEPEVRAWTIKRGTKAPQAAGKIQKRTGKKAWLLFAAVADKEYETMAKELCEGLNWAGIGVVHMNSDRGLSAGRLSDVFKTYASCQVVSYEDTEEAMEQMQNRAGDDLLFCAGSLYLIGELKVQLKKGEKIQ